MVTTATLMKEVASLPDEYAPEVLDFMLFIQRRKPAVAPPKPKVKSMYGAFRGLDPKFEREEDDRV